MTEEIPELTDIYCHRCAKDGRAAYLIWRSVSDDEDLLYERWTLGCEHPEHGVVGYRLVRRDEEEVK